MPFQPIPWGRQSITGEQLEADGSRLLNFYAVRAVQPNEAKTPVILHGTPGRARWAGAPGGRIYGLVEVQSPTWGHHICAVQSDGVFRTWPVASLATPDPTNTGMSAVFAADPSQRPTGPVQMATDGRRVLWVTARSVWAWDFGKAGGAGLIDILAPTPSDNAAGLPDQDWIDITWTDGYFILLARNGEIYHSVLAGVDFDQLDFALADARPDPGVGIHNLNRAFFVFGSRSIEVWYNAGNADFAFNRNVSFTAEYGCAARATIQKIDVAVLFLSSLGQVIAIAGTEHRPMSSETVQERIRLSDPAAARAFQYTEQGHRFYSLTLVVDGQPENWTLDLNTRLWHERSFTDIPVAVSLGPNSTFCAGPDSRPYLYRLGREFGYDELADGTREPVYREAITPVLHNSQARVQASSFEIDIPHRPGDDAATVELSWNDESMIDAGGDRVWKPTDPDRRRIKALVLPRLRFNQMGSFRNRNYRCSVATTRPVDVLNAYADYHALRD